MDAALLSQKPRISHGHEMRRFMDDGDDGLGGMPQAPAGRPRRDHRGNLAGGATNQTMQQYQLEETLEAKEHKRWLAHKDAALEATFPTALPLNGVEIPVFRYNELSVLGHTRLKQRALNLKDLLESAKCNFFPHHPHLALNRNAPAEVLLKWIIDVQVVIAAAIGMDDLDANAFGLPEQGDWVRRQPAPTPQQSRKQPPWSQHGINDGLDRQPPVRGGWSQSASPPREFPWSQHGINDDLATPMPGSRNWRAAPPSHQGFSLVPPHLAAGHYDDGAAGMGNSRFNDAAHIQQRGQGSSFVFG